MAVYEFDVVTEVDPYTPENQMAELYRLFKPLMDQGVPFTVVTLEGSGGGHPTVRVEGVTETIRDHMRSIGWDQESDEEFEEIYKVRTPRWEDDMPEDREAYYNERAEGFV